MPDLTKSPLNRYGTNKVACSHCGHEHIAVYLVPMKFPCECSRCNRMACFIVDIEVSP